MKKFLALALVLGSVVLGATAMGQSVSVKSLLRDMTDLSRLAQRPKPAYSEAQASSYDRAAKSPTENWFANGDNGKYIRTEVRDGRAEHVMADLKGPGVVTRFWSANPSGVVRYYFDGEAEPRFSADMSQLLQGKHPLFPDPFSYNASNGCNLYFPFPYAKSLKITLDESAGDRYRGVYYQIGFRTYGEGVKVESWTEAQVRGAGDDMKVQAAAMLDPAKRPTFRRPSGTLKASQSLQPFQTASVSANGSGAIQELRIRAKVVGAPANLEELPWENPNHEHNALRRARLTAEFDGVKGVDVPLCDFFGSTPGLTPYKSFPLEMRADGWMVCRFVMPYGKSVQIGVTNGSPVPLAVEIEADKISFPVGEGTYRFRAQWTADRLFSRPMRDMSYLDTTGEGRWIGSMLHIANPVPAWWGEGDEKIYVDGERFPSTFGTGTEDYYGYAWSSPTLFQRPYHAQPRCDGPGTQGHDCVMRWHILDDIPYTKSFKFDMELWHWAEVSVSFDRVAVWYALPGGPAIREVNGRMVAPVEIEKPKPVKGAIEGETLKVLSMGGGEREMQEFGELSSGKQLWWRDMQPGQTLRLALNVKEAGTFEVSGNFCMATDYGIHTIKIGGQALGGPVDFFSSALKWEKKVLGTVTLPAGEVVVEVECMGHREGAVPRNMFGLDYFLLTKRG